MSRHQFEQIDDLGRILFCDDPALRLEHVPMSVQTTDGTITLDRAQTRHMPAALFEFRHALGVGDFGYIAPKGSPPGPIPEEPQIEGAILFGMKRLPPDLWDPHPPETHSPPGHAGLYSIPGWHLHEIPDEHPKLDRRYGCTYSRLELRTPDGEIYSRTWAPHDPHWQAAALHHGYALCLAGVELGIRAPYAMTDTQHTPHMRHEALRRGCTHGLTIGGLITYTNHH
ncbi:MULTISPECIES: hypothetical protein [unclassified Streptomyces]|uniref:hypothetical protein n=1 Tax=unclassified Streptomyces TaxID=2593676 RepID=UPI00343A9B32